MPSDSCCSHEDLAAGRDNAFRRVLWIALAANAAMFLVEFAAGVGAGSVSLLADGLDFFGDAATYALSLYVLSMSLRARAAAALVKGGVMAAIGVTVLGVAVYRSVVLGLPSAEVMGAVGVLALAVNIGCAVMLFRHRAGDSNRRSVWICSRNDAIGNIAVVFAATGVFATGTPWPDILVGTAMAVLGISGAWQIARHARGELSTVGA